MSQSDECRACIERQGNGMPCGYFDHASAWISECGCECHEHEEDE
jgi:hypothetical protein